MGPDSDRAVLERCSLTAPWGTDGGGGPATEAHRSSLSDFIHCPSFSLFPSLPEQEEWRLTTGTDAVPSTRKGHLK